LTRFAVQNAPANIDRDAPPSPTRAGLAKGFIVGTLALAGLGIFEILTGHAGPGILAAVALELILALASFRPAAIRPKPAEMAGG
jgi:predicted lipid-binding transport protein (Tim44 family)